MSARATVSVLRSKKLRGSFRLRLTTQQGNGIHYNRRRGEQQAGCLLYNQGHRDSFLRCAFDQRGT